MYLEGTTCYAPSGTLASIAKRISVAPEALGTITISNSLDEPYKAVLEYASLSRPNEPDTYHPLDVMKVKCNCNVAGKADTVRTVSSMRSMHIPAGRNHHTKKDHEPRFTFGLGEAEIVWPPPPHLEPKFLARKNSEDGKDETCNSDITSNLESDETEERKVTKDHEKMEEDKLNDCRDNDLSKAAPIRIWVVHYSLGEKQSRTFISAEPIQKELLLVSKEGYRLKKFVSDVMRWKAEKDFADGDSGKYALYNLVGGRTSGVRWELDGMKYSRPLSSVILANGQMAKLLEDIQKFINPETKKWYLKHGLPYKRSYLFHGPPGTGKTSTIRAIASEFGFNCCFLSTTDDDISNQTLAKAFKSTPVHSLLVLEDVDSLFNEDRKSKNPSLTFSGFLNALDGLISPESLITVMTTNHIERLDQALIRGGRVDRRFEFALPSKEQLEDLFRKYYTDASQSTVQQFSEAVLTRPEGEEGRSIATLQQLFIEQREASAEECLKALPEFYESFFTEGSLKKKPGLYI